MIDIHFIIQIFLLTIFFSLLFFIINNVFSIKEGNQGESVSPADPFINPISNEIDAMFLHEKGTIVHELKKKIINIQNRLYNVKNNELFKLNAKYNTKGINQLVSNQNFAVTMVSKNNFDNIITIEVPIGEKGPEGPMGDPGDPGDQGECGEQGDQGYCGTAIKLPNSSVQ